MIQAWVLVFVSLAMLSGCSTYASTDRQQRYICPNNADDMGCRQEPPYHGAN